MSYNITAIPKFKKGLKKLAKKYPSLKLDFALFLESLQEKPSRGIALGNNCFKIRMAISSKGKGKSGGARIITCVQISQKSVYLLSIFDKSERENIPNKELKDLLKQISLQTLNK